jgi:hypothetical protein
MVHISQATQTILCEIVLSAARRRAWLGDAYVRELAERLGIADSPLLQGRPEERHAVHVEEEPAHVSLPG